MTTTRRRYCICGAAWKITSDPATVAVIDDLWKHFHEAPGHGPATRPMAANARRRQTRADRRASLAAAEARYR
jgi:hypothetical protein